MSLEASSAAVGCRRKEINHGGGERRLLPPRAPVSLSGHVAIRSRVLQRIGAEGCLPRQRHPYERAAGAFRRGPAGSEGGRAGGHSPVNHRGWVAESDFIVRREGEEVKEKIGAGRRQVTCPPRKPGPGAGGNYSLTNA